MMRTPALVLLLLLGCCSCSGSAPGAAPAPAASLDFGSVPGGVYETVAYYEPGPIGLLFNMMRAFLHVVQPNPFPQGKLLNPEPLLCPGDPTCLSKERGVAPVSVSLTKEGGVASVSVGLGKERGVASVSLSLSKEGGVASVSVSPSKEGGVASVSVGLSKETGVAFVSLSLSKEGGVASVSISLTKEGGVASVSVSLSKEGGVASVSVSLTKEEGVASVYVSLSKEGGVASVSVSLSKEGGVASVSVSLTKEGVTSVYVSLSKEGGVASVSVSLSKEGGVASVSVSLTKEEDLVIQVAKDKFGAIKSEYQKVIYYELGFVVCAVMGILFIVLVPLVGLLFCMCRCCDNCGGEMHQRQRKNADCQRGLLTTLLLTTTFIITKSTTDAIFALRTLMEKYRDGQRELHCVFVDLEKAYDRVPREELWYCMRKSGVAEKYVRVVQDMYERSRTVVRCAVGQTEEFKVEVGLHQGSALSPFLFAIVMDQLSEEVRQESPWTMMFANDIVICSESREQVEESLERWRFVLERRGMKVSRIQSNGECGKEVKKRVQAETVSLRKRQESELEVAELKMLSAGVLCAYAANQNLSSQLKTMRRLVNSNLKDMYTFANNTPVQIDHLISQYGTAKNQVLCDLDNIGQLLGGRIHEVLGNVVLPALDEAKNMAGVIQETKQALENVTVTLGVLQEGTAQLQSNLSKVRLDISNTLDDPVCASSPQHVVNTCLNIHSSLSQLEIGANYSVLPGVSEQLDNVNDVLKTNLSQIVHKGYLAFNDTPTMVTNQTKNIAEGVRGLLDGVGNNITRFSKLFPVQTTVNNATIFIRHAHSQIEDLYPQIDKMDFYRWIGCITLCCMVALILAFNFLGLLCGILGFDRHASPTSRGCVSNTGGNLLMAGVGFSFMFSWVLMGVVTVTFVVGGNVEKLVLDTPNLVNPSWKHFIPGYLYNDPEMDLTVENIYSNCKENHGIYSALHLDKVFNISALLNTSSYTKDVSKKFDDMKVDLKTIVLLTEEGKQNLISFTKTGINNIDFAAYIDELSKGVTRVDLLSFANVLDSQADQLPKGSVQTSVKSHANTLRQIYSKQVIPLQQSMNTMNQSIRFLERTATDLSYKITEILEVAQAAQYLISHNATFAINQEREKYKQTIIGYFKQYVDWIKTSLMMDVATCKPLSNIVDTAEILACGLFFDSMNTFWFGLGCSALFLLPSIILSVRLAKFYRRMDTEDVYDDIDTIPMKTMFLHVALNRPLFCTGLFLYTNCMPVFEPSQFLRPGGVTECGWKLTETLDYPAHEQQSQFRAGDGIRRRRPDTTTATSSPLSTLH
ncbi:hypothetical protein QTP70_023719 [Hemibagrus guttatus]|uniref:ribonuclease H n=1 Tax=Hemibagrus guttatus TaxID=175788 RepID=A0AAE0V260_9TELE|nr:hypothetical protein QTP70_023719 [Hemibagrus guttatus]